MIWFGIDLVLMEKTMLFLRLLCQNNELASFRKLCNVIENCTQIPPEFHKFSRLMRLIIVIPLRFHSSIESGWRGREISQAEDASGIVFDVSARDAAHRHLRNHLSVRPAQLLAIAALLLLRRSAVLSKSIPRSHWYSVSTFWLIDFCGRGLRCQYTLPLLYIRRARANQRVNRIIPVLEKRGNWVTGDVGLLRLHAEYEGNRAKRTGYFELH